MINEDHSLKCHKCGTEVSSESNYCNSCGARVYDLERIMASGKFSFKLSAYSALLTFIFMLLFSFLTAYFYTLHDQDLMNNPEKLIIISMIGPALGIFISTMFTSYIFISIRIKETFAGAAAIIIIFKISDFILASTFTIEGVGVALISCLIALTGAWLGFSLKKKFKI